MKSKNNPSVQQQYDNNILLKDIIDSIFFEKDYNFLTMKLLYENYDYDKAINEGIIKVVNKNIF